jgi:S1-C subfamily serine protease
MEPETMSTRPLRPLVVLAVTLGLALPALRADTVKLKNGTVLEGTVMIQTATKLLINVNGSTQIIPLADVDSVTKSAEPAAEPVERPAPASRDTGPAEQPQLAPLMPPAGVPMQPGIRYRVPDPKYPDGPNGINGMNLARPDPYTATVQVTSTHAAPDLSKPWARLPIRTVSGSGFVVTGQRILTNAHLVEYATDIQIAGNRGEDKFSAHVVALDPVMDLALLKLDDETFFTSHPALPFDGTMPPVGETLHVYGMSEGSNNVVVSHQTFTNFRFEHYTERTRGLMLMLNSVIEDAKSGGPVTQREDARQLLIGMACARPGSGSRAHNFVIPMEELTNFMQRAATGTYPRTGLYDDVQLLQNPALREFLRAPPTVHGVVVTRAFGQDQKVLQDWDVLSGFWSSPMSDTETPIDDAGMVPVFFNFRVNFRHALNFGGNPQYTTTDVFRAGQPAKVAIWPGQQPPMLVPDAAGAEPSYFIFGPIVFARVTTQVQAHLSNEGLDGLLASRSNPIVTRGNERPVIPDQELVYVPAPFFPSDLTRGYASPAFSVVKSINGTLILNLADLVKTLRDSKEEFLIVEFFDQPSQILVLPRAAMAAATDGILNDNNVRSQGSPDMMAIWNAK